ncbi:hypothetical protein FA041_18645 [Escherichia coli]|nr:hypothetical protein [Escherichia coli]
MLADCVSCNAVSDTFPVCCVCRITGEQRKSGRRHAFNLGTLINYQALLVGNLIGVPLCYFIIRVVRNPFYLRSYYSQLKQQVDVKVTKKSSHSGYWH